MSPKFDMPILRQLPRDSDRTFWRRLLWWTEPVIYELVEDYIYSTTLWTGQRVILFIPAGFRTDLASTPRSSWLFGYRPDGILLVPGLFHDWFYRHGFVVDVGVPGHRHIGHGDKAFGDRLLAHLAREISGLRLPGLVAWIALTLFGWPAWRHNKKHRDACRQMWKYQLKGDYK